MKTYRQHDCTAKHRTYNRMARCIWRRAHWVNGEGPYAVVAYCNGATITLWAEPEDASAVLKQIDHGGCGGFCHKKHDLLVLVLP
jgi:hypothetical protein